MEWDLPIAFYQNSLFKFRIGVQKQVKVVTQMTDVVVNLAVCKPYIGNVAPLTVSTSS